jgi:glucokinase
MRYAIGVDVGGGSAKLGVVSQGGDILFQHRLATPEADHAGRVAHGYAGAIQAVVEQCRGAGIEPAGIGVGMPGHISPDRRSASLTNVPVLDGFPLADFLSQRFGLPVLLDNDATLAALAEYHYGGGQHARRLLAVTVGTGLGAGLVVGGQAQRPVRGCIGDPGHIIVAVDSPWRCSLGCRGCLETVASSQAIEREATALAGQYPDSELARLASAGGVVSTAGVIGAARAGDALASRVIRQAAHWLGIGLVSWCYFFDPDLVLIGGGVSVAEDLLLEPARETLRARALSAYAGSVQIGLARLGNDAGVIGAASLFLTPSTEEGAWSKNT